MEELKSKDLCLRQNLAGLKSSLKYVKTIFGEVPEKIVTFCFDTSGSMYRIFYHFREQLIETLFQMLFSGQSQKFNVVLFNSSIHQCYSKHVQCKYDNIISAIEWMNKAYYESKSNMLGGLIKSFEDDPDVVYLVTDGYPSTDRQELLSHLPHITKGRPIRSIMITNKVPPDDCPLNFLEEIAEITNGSVSVISVATYGAVEVLMPVYYQSRPIGMKRMYFNRNSDEKNECLKKRNVEKTLHGDPMEDLPLVAPFIIEDPLSGKSCPFYSPYFHWYWPQFWHENGPGPYCMWAKNDPQYNCMAANFRESRAFISGRQFLESYRDPKHILPYAGMMLINKRVLACNHEDGNNYYIGKVLSQVTPTHFHVKFDSSGEYDEVQKTELSEIIDVDEQKRHSINVNDYVLAPIKSEKEAYSIAIVLSGCESRDAKKTIIPIKNTPVTVRFLNDESEKTIEPYQAILLSSRLKQIVQRSLNRISSNRTQDSFNSEKPTEIPVQQKSEQKHSIIFKNHGTNNNCVEDRFHGAKAMEPCSICSDPFRCCCCIDRLHRCIDGRAASPVDDGNAVTLEQIKEQINENLKKTKDVSESDHCDICSDDEEEDTEHSDSSHGVKYDSEWDEQTHCTDEFTETDINWCILRLLNKHSKQKQTNKDKRPPWKYWGHKSIPDVIDPPNSEPYDDPFNWGCLMPKPAVEWPSTSFQVVDPHRVTNYSPQKMYETFKHQVHRSSQRPKRDASVGRDSIPPEETTKKLLERRFNYLQGGYPRLEIKNPYNDSVKPILSSWSAVGSIRNQKNVNNCLNLLEKSRIESQVQRDESNILRYIETKPKTGQSAVQFR